MHPASGMMISWQSLFGLEPFQKDRLCLPFPSSISRIFPKASRHRTLCATPSILRSMRRSGATPASGWPSTTTWWASPARRRAWRSCPPCCARRAPHRDVDVEPLADHALVVDVERVDGHRPGRELDVLGGQALGAVRRPADVRRVVDLCDRPVRGWLERGGYKRGRDSRNGKEGGGGQGGLVRIGVSIGGGWIRGLEV